MATATGLPPEAVEKLPPSVSSLQVASGDNLHRAGHAGLFKTLLWVLLVLSVGAFVEPSRCRATGAARSSPSAAAHVRRDSTVRRAHHRRLRCHGRLADAPNAHAVADDAWGIATSLLVDAAEGSFLFGLSLPPAPGSGRRAPRHGDPRVSAYPLRERPGLVRAGLGVAIPLLVNGGRFRGHGSSGG